jgi:hypothetical protein
MRIVAVHHGMTHSTTEMMNAVQVMNTGSTTAVVVGVNEVRSVVAVVAIALMAVWL